MAFTVNPYYQVNTADRIFLFIGREGLDRTQAWGKNRCLRKAADRKPRNSKHRLAEI